MVEGAPSLAFKIDIKAIILMNVRAASNRLQSGLYYVHVPYIIINYYLDFSIIRYDLGNVPPKCFEEES